MLRGLWVCTAACWAKKEDKCAGVQSIWAPDWNIFPISQSGREFKWELLSRCSGWMDRQQIIQYRCPVETISSAPGVSSTLWKTVGKLTLFTVCLSFLCPLISLCVPSAKHHAWHPTVAQCLPLVWWNEGVSPLFVHGSRWSLGCVCVDEGWEQHHGCTRKQSIMWVLAWWALLCRNQLVTRRSVSWGVRNGLIDQQSTLAGSPCYLGENGETQFFRSDFDVFPLFWGALKEQLLVIVIEKDLIWKKNRLRINI